MSAAKNEADSVLYACEKALKEHGDKVSQDERAAIDRGIADLKEAIKSDDVERMNKAKEDVLKASHKLAQEVYKEASKAHAAQGAPGKEEGSSKGGKGGDDVMDAEVVDDGPGFANAANLFVPFFTTKPKGSGIGLVLCRQIAEAHGGSLRLRNRDDASGCVAELRLPLPHTA